MSREEHPSYGRFKQALVPTSATGKRPDKKDSERRQHLLEHSSELDTVIGELMPPDQSQV